ncbi:trypsin-like peptidase domain-containing protein [unidentified bacterial endosymbiont]|uniref:trypsin-like peptidase domain-containing protein n=1 Tax=unidentified bacterial endosymbiont TaxID=2355 RepID=UPI00209F38D0|nr:trypsin-like peptidase domain-containing protein [unidentified bacterial endosymbiont]
MLVRIGQALIRGGLAAALILFGVVWGSQRILGMGVLPALFGWQPDSYQAAVRRAAPAVVHVYRDLESAVEGSVQLGSGVILTPDGYIITNHHVIEQATHITVALQDGRVFKQVRLIGFDRLTDIAVLKIEANPLPTIRYNLDRSAQIGDVVLAIGNPFNLGQTVTQGIISATERIHLSPYGVGKQNFLQTDAAINQGNSGGALVNTLGELIGINTLILLNEQSNEGRSESISFAIPIQLALEVMHKIIRDGRVIRGYLGFDVVELSAHQRSLLGLAQSSGLFVKAVDQRGLAKSVMKPADIILEVNGVPVASPLATMAQVAEIRPGTQIKLTVLREGLQQTLLVTVAESPMH